MVEFRDTEVAFRDKNRKELTRALWLFRLVGSPLLVFTGSALLRFAMAIGIPLKWALKPTIFAYFCGGESINECEVTVRKLYRSGIQSILDYSAEGKEKAEEFENTKRQILQTIDKAHADPAVPYAVFKPSGLVRFALLEKLQSGASFAGKEQQEYERFIGRLHGICAYARKMNVPVMVDAEESWIQAGIDRLMESLMLEYNKEKPLVYNTLQMYRHDRLEYLRQMIKKANDHGVYAAFKLVRGAYMEKERKRALKMGCLSPIYPDKQATDHAFDSAVKMCLDQLNHVAVCVGTHNEESCAGAVGYLIEKKRVANHPHVSFAQLLGMSDHISYKLASLGYNVCKYVPYGPVHTVVPYLIRRAEENTSVAGQTPRELAMIREEIKRRKKRAPGTRHRVRLAAWDKSRK